MLKLCTGRQVFERRTGVDLAGAKDSDKKKKALSKLRNACAQVRGPGDSVGRSEWLLWGLSLFELAAAPRPHVP